jgi:hypothetical protein
MQGHLHVPIDERGLDTTEKDADDTAKAWGFEADLNAFRDESVKLDGILRREVPRFLSPESSQAN